MTAKYSIAFKTTVDSSRKALGVVMIWKVSQMHQCGSSRQRGALKSAYART